MVARVEWPPLMSAAFAPISMRRAAAERSPHACPPHPREAPRLRDVRRHEGSQGQKVLDHRALGIRL